MYELTSIHEKTGHEFEIELKGYIRKLRRKKVGNAVLIISKNKRNNRKGSLNNCA